MKTIIANNQRWLYDENMIKLLPIGVVVGLMLAVLLYLRFSSSDNKLKSALPNYQPVTQSPSGLQTPAADTNDRLRTLEETVVLLSEKVAGQKSAPASVNQTTSWGGVPENRVKNLEDTVASLQKQIDALKTSSNPVSSKTPVYIPIGSGGVSTDQNYSSLEGFQVSIDPGDYSGYTSMVLEVNAKLSQQVGIGYVRLYNSTDNSAVSSSEVSFTSDKYTLGISSTFKLSGGKKTYQLQLKSSQGRDLYLQNVRLRVNF